MRKFPIRREKYYAIESVETVQRLEGRDVSDGNAGPLLTKSKVRREEMVGLKGRTGAFLSLSVCRSLYDVPRLP